MSDLDPYQTPESSLEELDQLDSSEINTDGWSLASRWQRLGAWFIDAILNGLAAMAVGLPLIWIGIDYSLATLFVLEWVVTYGLYLLINGYWMAKDGQTIGKKALGIYMVGNDSNRVVPLGSIVAKRYLPFWVIGSVPVIGNIISLINALFIFGQEKRCLHDLTAGTKVVAKPSLSYPAPAPPKWD